MSDLDVAARHESRGAALLDWTLRIVIAVVFLLQGIDKFGSRRLWINLFAEIGIGQWFRYATGVVEVLGAAFILVPRMTTAAVVLLAGTMVGALLAHVFIMGVGRQSILVGVLLGMILTIGWRHHRAAARSI